jgi:predicted O-linked N-acetylglucosamine transferase (SPINDLY family)
MKPADPALHKALLDMRAGRSEAAIAALRKLLARRPKDTDATQMLALLLLQAGQHAEALQWLDRAVAAQPRAVAYRNNYANALMQHKRAADAAAQWEEAVRIDPAYALGWLGLTAARLHLRDSQGAIAAAEQGLKLRPGWPQLTTQLMMALEAADRLDEAYELGLRSLQAAPGQPAVRSMLLMLSNYRLAPAAQAAELHREFGRHHAGTPSLAAPQPRKDGVLRIGILSGDLRTHSVAFFAEPLLRSRPDWASITVFSLGATPDDAMTQRLRALADDWHEVGPLDDRALEQAIRHQNIDVLLELHGHTGGNRLTALAAKPVPVIVTALGYPNTTGHPAVDWRAVDSITDPPGAEALATERLLRLDPCFLCYSPPPDAPQPLAPEPAQRLTFGSFNALSKLSDQTLALWARVLGAAPGSQLLLKTQALADPAAREHLLVRMGQAGIAPDRVELLPATRSIAEHLAQYARVHVALDTVPYNGTTTTCEALWMGVPVVCLEGDRHAGRVGASLLNAVGRPELLARTEDDFVRIACVVAASAQTLQSRLARREQMLASALMDASVYAERFHAGLRECWRETRDPRQK